MRSNTKAALATVLVAVLVPVLLAGCSHPSGEAPQEGETIPPRGTQRGQEVNLGLGPGVRPLSFGPGDKGSPRPGGPSGDRIAFVLDGYAAEKTLRGGDDVRRAGNDSLPGATATEWLPDGSLAVLGPRDGGAASGSPTMPLPGPLFGTRLADSQTEGVQEPLADGVLSMGTVPGGGGAVVAAVAVQPEMQLGDGPKRSRLVLLRGSEEPVEVHLKIIDGWVTGLSVSPDGRGAALAILGDDGRFEVRIYRFSEGFARRAARVPEGMEILGAPQWTSRGIHFVAGDAGGPVGTAEQQSPLYALYRASEASISPEPVPGIGEDFMAAGIRVSPDGGRLAVVGRRNPSSPTNLYVLDLQSGSLEPVTNNENMEIKTNPRDFAWSPDGLSVVLVARGALSGPEVYDAPARSLSSAFYNLYEVSVNGG